MSGTSYNGIPGNVVSPSAVNIVSSTNASPIIITTATAHGMRTGDVCHVQRHQTNTAANGEWSVVVVDATDIKLTGSVGNGVGGATGSVNPLVFTGNVSLNPANGDPFDANTFIPGFSCLADRTAFLALNTGAYKVAGKFVANGGTQFNSWATIVGGLTATALTDWSSGGIMPFVAGGGSTLDVVAGDLVIVDVMTSFDATVAAGDSATTRYAVVLLTTVTAPGGAPSYLIQGDVESSVIVPGSGSSTLISGVHLGGVITCGISGTIDFKLMAESNANTARTLSLDGLYRASAVVLRPTVWTQ